MSLMCNKLQEGYWNVGGKILFPFVEISLINNFCLWDFKIDGAFRPMKRSKKHIFLSLFIERASSCVLNWKIS